MDVPNAVADGDRARRAHGARAAAPAARARRPRRAAKRLRSCCTSSRLSEMARARLKVIYENTDGFEIARQDLLLRGPGEFLGRAPERRAAAALRRPRARHGPDRAGARRGRANCSRRSSPAVTTPPRPLARQPAVLPQGMNKLTAAPRRLREADPARQADRHPAAAVADAVGAVARGRARAATGAVLWLFVLGTCSCARPAARSTTSPTATSTRTWSARGTGRSPPGAIQPWEALVVAARPRACRLRLVLTFNRLTVHARRSRRSPSRRSIPFTKRFFWLPQAWLGHGLRLRHPDGVRGASRATAAAGLGAARRPTSSGPSPTTPSTRWWIARTT